MITQFNSKILLFGEYSIIKDSEAIALPYNAYSGHLTFDPQHSVDQELKELASYIRSKQDAGDFLFHFDIEKFEKDIEKGLKFESTIPQGFGMGSSGALCAALYSYYGNVSPHQLNLELILSFKKILSQIESHFHGASSGIDPLVSFINKPLLIKNKSDIRIVDIPKYTEGEKAIFLLNTQRARKTEPLVNLFLEKCQNQKFNDLCSKILLPITNGCIDSFLSGEPATLYEFYRELSNFQYRHFTPMIPKMYLDLWAQGLEKEQFYLKLCGAGGGGFLMGMTTNYRKVVESLKDRPISPLFFFK